jgi:aryl-alcohol dehydrogenase-like predicted oxidoreductase
VKFRALGQTGLRVSVLGLGTGSRFGDPRLNPPDQATRLVRAALDLGVNYIDVAAMYGEAESILGGALHGIPRSDYVLATKVFPADPAGNSITPAELRASVTRSLRRLRTDAVDLLQLHGVRPGWLAPVMATLGEELETLQREGKFRHLGVAETIREDPTHQMIPAAAASGRFAAALIAYNLLSPWAETQALPACHARGLGVVGMVAVRRALHDPALLGRLIQAGRDRGDPGLAELPADDSLRWLLDEHSPTLAAAGYRFAIAHPAVATVLAGTLNLDHLRANVQAVSAPPLPAALADRVRRIFLRTDPLHWNPYDL